MYLDPIVEEVRRAREAYAARFNYDLDAICNDLMERQAKHGKGVTLAPKRVTPRTDKPESEVFDYLADRTTLPPSGGATSTRSGTNR
jgi:hypothetical protein